MSKNSDNNLTEIPKIVSTIGFKPANNKTLNFLRVAIAITIAGLCIWAIVTDYQEELDVKELEDIIPTNCIFHQAIAEIPDDQHRINCTLAFREILSDNETKKEKLYRSIKIALLASIVSEFIVNGNLDKPVSVIGKTLTFTLINTMLTF